MDNIRPWDEWSDSSFILSSWSKSTASSIPNSFTPIGQHMGRQKELIKALIVRGATVLVCHSPEDEKQILGWVCFETFNGVSAIHFLYVKSSCRKQGIGTKLLRATGLEGKEIPCSAITYITKKNILGDKYAFIYLPALLDGLLESQLEEK